jgi:hypothetical protein
MWLPAWLPPASDLGVIARMPVAQLDPMNEADARLFKRDRGCWKSGLRSARFTNAYCRRPSAPPRKMTEDPVQRGGQSVPVPMSALSRHVSIMRLLPLGYEASDMRLRRLGPSPTCGLTSAAVWPVVDCGGARLPRLSLSRRVPFTDRFTDQVPDLNFLACATAHASPGWSSRHRRPTHRGAGQAPRVKVERPTGRTTLARGAWSARLALGLMVTG